VSSLCLRRFLAGFLLPVRRWGVPTSDFGFDDGWVGGGVVLVGGCVVWPGDEVVPGSWMPFTPPPLEGHSTVTGTTSPVMSLT
jgi:hypothetical protein